jgi:hypothetical protein
MSRALCSDKSAAVRGSSSIGSGNHQWRVPDSTGSGTCGLRDESRSPHARARRPDRPVGGAIPGGIQAHRHTDRRNRHTDREIQRAHKWRAPGASNHGLHRASFWSAARKQSLRNGREGLESYAFPVRGPASRQEVKLDSCPGLVT